MRKDFRTRCIHVVYFFVASLLPHSVYAACGEPATLISAIQGNADQSPLVGQVHIVEGVVTASYQANSGLRGFFIQEEKSQHDADEATSEGVFVFHQATPVEAGTTIRLTGEVQERFGQTQLANVSDIKHCMGGDDDKPKPVSIRLPKQHEDSFEAVEGMLVKLKDDVVVTDNNNLGRFGEFTVSGKERLMLPSQVHAPGEAHDELVFANELNRLVIDDASNAQNPDVVPFPSPALDAHNSLRAGEEIKTFTGVMAYAFGEYRVHPVESLRIKNKNPRPAMLKQDRDDDEQLRIASFNLGNYFNGDGSGGGFPTSRGADSHSEFERQSQKLSRAIAGLNAAIIGVAELENDGYASDSAIASLADFVNHVSRDQYTYIDPGMTQLGNDVIAVGILYQPDRVTPVGDAHTLSDAPFDELSRQPLAQSFVANESAFEFMVVMNHFKSKSCSGARGGDRDQGDGQGCYNATRVASAQTLVTWLDSISVNPHKIILGDLNSYAREAPVNVLEAAGYRNKLNDEDDYSFVFDGQAGVLDYALYSESLRKSVKRVKAWHINADEPRVLDYNEEFKSAGQVVDYFNDDPYRSSDHDPVYLILKLKDD